MFKLMLVWAVMVSLAIPAAAKDWAVAIPESMTGGGAPIKQALWQFFLRNLGPGDSYGVLNATTPGQVASVRIPDEAKYARAKWRAKTFARENARIGAFVDEIGNGAASIDLMGALRHVALNRLDEGPLDLLVIGSVVQRFPDEPAFSMQGDGGYLVPSPAHLQSSVSKSPYGMGSESADGLQNVTVHLCPIGVDLSSDAEAAYQRFFGSYIAKRGGTLMTWSDDLATCVERFGAQARQPIAFEPYADFEGALEMQAITRAPVVVETVEEVEEPKSRKVNGVDVESFNLFASESHPTLPGVTVTTGIEYQPDGYPAVYDHAWCYFNVTKDGVQVRFDLGRKSFDEEVLASESTRSSLRAGGITKGSFEAGKSACQWPTP